MAGNSAQQSNPLTVAQWIGFISLVLGNFAAVLDIQIVASSLLDIQAGLAASTDDMAWVQSAYLIAEVIAIPMSGYLSRLLSTRNFFLISVAGFTAMSVGAAFAWNIESMIFFRFLQGLFGGGMIPTTMSAIFILFPKDRQMKAQVIVGLVSTLAPVAGPTLGGYLTEMLSWHWLFLINVVPGILIFLGVSRFVRIDKPDLSLLKTFDVLGVVSMAGFLGALEYVLEEGPRNNWLDDTAISCCLIVSVACGLAFFWRMLTSPEPLVDLRSLKDRNFALGSAFGFVLGVVLYGANFAQPLYLGQVRGFSSLQIGQLMAVSGAVMFFSAPLVGRFSTVVPKRYIVGLGLLCLATSSYISSFMDSQWGFEQMLVPQLVRGFGLICCFIPLSALALGTMAPSQVKNASGLYNLMRNLGGAFGLAYLNTLITSKQAYHWQQLIPNIRADRPEAVQAIDEATNRFATAGLPDPHGSAIASIAQSIKLESLVMTYNDLFHVIFILAVVATLAVPLLKESASSVDAGSH
ncbi:DHA2 family efflux MFS transporter permease subunit [Burkholderia cenocepacia]|uniref:DHA2 family efflux MFS transporter permease subunit n=1 Tax=Burkholderia cenocepacia TaxID=95486 RepID=UPI00076D14E9|nr:DHA2 family efflux MFS transporter permease subunit [Burkholderia cenocepacia]KWU17920.1 hypothetical protein AS149_14695 [Burkholderia cenocepacia]